MRQRRYYQYLGKEETIRDIAVATAAMHFHVSAERILTERRGVTAVVDARALAIYMVYRFTSFPSSVVGKLFKRDHSSVLHNTKKVIALCAIDSGFKKIAEAAVLEFSGRLEGMLAHA